MERPRRSESYCGGNSKIMIKKRSKKDVEMRIKSNRSFKIYNPDGSLFAEMSEGKWVKKPETEVKR